MYHYIAGKLIEKSATSIVVEAGGIGYFIQIPVSTFTNLPVLGESVRVLTHFVVREDAQLLYGFYSEEERALFRQLISVSGIGPKTALTAMSGISIQELKKAIIDGSLHVLTAVPGIGRKTAERLIVELREKIVLDERYQQQALGSSKIQADDERVEDCIRALVELGYRKQNAKEAVQKVLKDAESRNLSVPDLIRASLKCL